MRSSVQNPKGVSSAAAVGVLVLILVVALLFFMFSSGSLSGLFGSGGGSNVTSVFTVSSSIDKASLLQNQNASIIMSYVNPFSQPLNVGVNLSIGVGPLFLMIANPSRTLTMPASMSSLSSLSFIAECKANLQSPEQISSTFSVYISDVSQNVTTSILTYVSGSQPLQQYYSAGQGFLSISAQPLELQTNPSSSSTRTGQSTMDISLFSAIYSGQPYTSGNVNAPNDELNSLTLSLDNSSGAIASAFVTYNGQTYKLTGTGSSSSTLKTTIPGLSLQLVTSGAPLPLIVTAFNNAAASQNLLTISTNYNYYFTRLGPIISCQ